MRKSNRLGTGCIGCIDKLMLLLGALALSQGALAITSVSSSLCDSRLDVSIAAGVRTSTPSEHDSEASCQDRSLTDSAGFSLSTSALSSTTPVVDSVAMESADGELYEAFATGGQRDAVLLTPNRALMMSRSVSGTASDLSWDMGLLVQPVTGGSNAWLSGYYTIMRANREFRTMNATQTNDGLSQVFDAVTLDIEFIGDGTCDVMSDHNTVSSWLGYELTTDPDGAQPGADDYGLHQAVYAGDTEGADQHPDSNLNYISCSYSLDGDGLLTVDLTIQDGDTNDVSGEFAYYVSADMRYLVSTVDTSVSSTTTIFRGFEVGFRQDDRSADDQATRNANVVGTFLFNASMVEWEGATGVLSEPDVENRSNEKSTECLVRGAIDLTSAVSGEFNECTIDLVKTCAIRSEEGTVPNVDLVFATTELIESVSSSNCTYQVGAYSALTVNATMDTFDGPQSVSFAGSISDNNEAIVLRGKYEGGDMADPSVSTPPERTIKEYLQLSAGVGIKYEGVLTDDTDGDGSDNLAEFLYSDFARSFVKSDTDGDGDSDIIWREDSTGTLIIWHQEAFAKVGENTFAGFVTHDLVDSADFDADGDADLVVFNDDPAVAQALRWEMEDHSKVSGALLAGFPGWVFKGVGDFDADGDDDIIWQNEDGGASTDGLVVVWIMEDNVKVSGQSLGRHEFGARVVAIGDFDNDSDADLLQSIPSAPSLVRWDFQNGTKVAGAAIGGFTGYSVQAVGDFNKDGSDDILWEPDGGGSSSILWRMKGGDKEIGNAVGTLSGYSIAAIGDYDGDRDYDLLWKNANGVLIAWEIEDAVKQSGQLIDTLDANHSVRP